MSNWFAKIYYKGYRATLLNSFPLTLKVDVEAVLDILPFANNEVVRSDGQVFKANKLIHTNSLSVLLENKSMTIPRRIYINEPDKKKESKLTDTQRTILNCIYLRHHDGYVRQRRLEQLADKGEYWVTPFTFHLIGEYVFEILLVLDKYLNDKRIENYVRFVQENPKYWQQTESRMISYWNEYYRSQYKTIKDYPGRQLVDRIKRIEYTFIILKGILKRNS